MIVIALSATGVLAVLAIIATSHRARAYTFSLLHPYTVGRSLVAVATGAHIAITSVQRWVDAKGRAELLQANPVKHDRITRHRAWAAFAGGCLDVFAELVLWYALGRWAALTVWTGLHIMVLYSIGRNGPTMHRVQVRGLAGESLIRQVADEITSTAESRKAAQTIQITRPVSRLASGKGYDVEVRVPQLANPKALADGASSIEHKLKSAKRTVFVYTVHADASCYRILVLDKDPWSGAPTVNPLVANPRPVNLWREAIDLGNRPDASDYLRRLVEEGDGGGALFGGAPRSGKTNLFNNLIVAILLHRGSRLHMVDCKGLDFAPIQPVCDHYIVPTPGLEPLAKALKLLRESTALLREMAMEIDRRQAILVAAEAENLTEDLADRLDMPLHWVMIDELAVMTEDIIAQAKDQVNEFLGLLLTVVRLGPAFGIFCLLATQRPTKNSTPPPLKGLIVLRAALYIGDYSGSASILSKSGLANRADLLDPTQKGVAIVVGEGQIRWHRVQLKDLASVVAFAASMRSGVNLVKTEAGLDYPPLVKAMLALFHVEHDPDEMPTYKLLAGLAEFNIYHSATTLAGELKQFGVEPKNVGSDRRKGYSRVALEKVPRAALIAAPVGHGHMIGADPSGERAAEPLDPVEPTSMISARLDPEDNR